MAKPTQDTREVVLILDDDAQWLDECRRELEARGYSCQHSSSIEEATAKLKNRDLGIRYALIDYEFRSQGAISSQTGASLIKKMRSLRQDVLFVLISGVPERMPTPVDAVQRNADIVAEAGDTPVPLIPKTFFRNKPDEAYSRLQGIFETWKTQRCRRDNPCVLWRWTVHPRIFSERASRLQQTTALRLHDYLRAINSEDGDTLAFLQPQNLISILSQWEADRRIRAIDFIVAWGNLNDGKLNDWESLRLGRKTQPVVRDLCLRAELHALGAAMPYIEQDRRPSTSTRPRKQTPEETFAQGDPRQDNSGVEIRRNARRQDPRFLLLYQLWERKLKTHGFGEQFNQAFITDGNPPVYRPLFPLGVLLAREKS